MGTINSKEMMSSVKTLRNSNFTVKEMQPNSDLVQQTNATNQTNGTKSCQKFSKCNGEKNINSEENVFLKFTDAQKEPTSAEKEATKVEIYRDVRRKEMPILAEQTKVNKLVQNAGTTNERNGTKNGTTVTRENHQKIFQVIGDSSCNSAGKNNKLNLTDATKESNGIKKETRVVRKCRALTRKEFPNQVKKNNLRKLLQKTDVTNKSSVTKKGPKGKSENHRKISKVNEKRNCNINSEEKSARNLTDAQNESIIVEKEATKVESYRNLTIKEMGTLREQTKVCKLVQNADRTNEPIGTKNEATVTRENHQKTNGDSSCHSAGKNNKLNLTDTTKESKGTEKETRVVRKCRTLTKIELSNQVKKRDLRKLMQKTDVTNKCSVTKKKPNGRSENHQKFPKVNEDSNSNNALNSKDATNGTKEEAHGITKILQKLSHMNGDRNSNNARNLTYSSNEPSGIKIQDRVTRNPRNVTKEDMPVLKKQRNVRNLKKQMSPTKPNEKQNLLEALEKKNVLSRKKMPILQKQNELFTLKQQTDERNQSNVTKSKANLVNKNHQSLSKINGDTNNNNNPFKLTIESNGTKRKGNAIKENRRKLLKINCDRHSNPEDANNILKSTDTTNEFNGTKVNGTTKNHLNFQKVNSDRSNSPLENSNLTDVTNSKANVVNKNHQSLSKINGDTNSNNALNLTIESNGTKRKGNEVKENRRKLPKINCDRHSNPEDANNILKSTDTTNEFNGTKVNGTSKNHLNFQKFNSDRNNSPLENSNSTDVPNSNLLNLTEARNKCCTTKSKTCAINQNHQKLLKNRHSIPVEKKDALDLTDTTSQANGTTATIMKENREKLTKVKCDQHSNLGDKNNKLNSTDAATKAIGATTSAINKNCQKLLEINCDKHSNPGERNNGTDLTNATTMADGTTTSAINENCQKLSEINCDKHSNPGEKNNKLNSTDAATKATGATTSAINKNCQKLLEMKCDQHSNPGEKNNGIDLTDTTIQANGTTLTIMKENREKLTKVKCDRHSNPSEKNNKLNSTNAATEATTSAINENCQKLSEINCNKHSNPGEKNNKLNSTDAATKATGATTFAINENCQKLSENNCDKYSNPSEKNNGTDLTNATTMADGTTTSAMNENCQKLSEINCDKHSNPGEKNNGIHLTDAITMVDGTTTGLDILAEASLMVQKTDDGSAVSPVDESPQTNDKDNKISVDDVEAVYMKEDSSEVDDDCQVIFVQKVKRTFEITQEKYIEGTNWYTLSKTSVSSLPLKVVPKSSNQKVADKDIPFTAGDTISSNGPTKEQDNHATGDTIFSNGPNKEQDNHPMGDTISSNAQNKEQSNDATGDTISSNGPTKEQDNHATGDTISSIGPNKEQDNHATGDTISSNGQNKEQGNDAAEDTISVTEPDNQLNVQTSNGRISLIRPNEERCFHGTRETTTLTEQDDEGDELDEQGIQITNGCKSRPNISLGIHVNRNHTSLTELDSDDKTNGGISLKRPNNKLSIHATGDQTPLSELDEQTTSSRISLIRLNNDPCICVTRDNIPSTEEGNQLRIQATDGRISNNDPFILATRDEISLDGSGNHLSNQTTNGRISLKRSNNEENIHATRDQTTLDNGLGADATNVSASVIRPNIEQNVHTINSRNSLSWPNNDAHICVTSKDIFVTRQENQLNVQPTNGHFSLTRPNNEPGVHATRNGISLTGLACELGMHATNRRITLNRQGNGLDLHAIRGPTSSTRPTDELHIERINSHISLTGQNHELGIHTTCNNTSLTGPYNELSSHSMQMNSEFINIEESRRNLNFMLGDSVGTVSRFPNATNFEHNTRNRLNQMSATIWEVNNAQSSNFVSSNLPAIICPCNSVAVASSTPMINPYCVLPETRQPYRQGTYSNAFFEPPNLSAVHETRYELIKNRNERQMFPNYASNTTTTSRLSAINTQYSSHHANIDNKRPVNSRNLPQMNNQFPSNYPSLENNRTLISRNLPEINPQQLVNYANPNNNVATISRNLPEINAQFTSNHRNLDSMNSNQLSRLNNGPFPQNAQFPSNHRNIASMHSNQLSHLNNGPVPQNAQFPSNHRNIASMHSNQLSHLNNGPVAQNAQFPSNHRNQDSMHSEQLSHLNNGSVPQNAQFPPNHRNQDSMHSEQLSHLNNGPVPQNAQFPSNHRNIASMHSNQLSHLNNQQVSQNRATLQSIPENSNRQRISSLGPNFRSYAANNPLTNGPPNKRLRTSIPPDSHETASSHQNVTTDSDRSESTTDQMEAEGYIDVVNHSRLELDNGAFSSPVFACRICKVSVPLEEYPRHIKIHECKFPSNYRKCVICQNGFLQKLESSINNAGCHLGDVCNSCEIVFSRVYTFKKNNQSTNIAKPRDKSLVGNKVQANNLNHNNNNGSNLECEVSVEDRSKEHTNSNINGNESSISKKPSIDDQDNEGQIKKTTSPNLTNYGMEGKKNNCKEQNGYEISNIETIAKNITERPSCSEGNGENLDEIRGGNISEVNNRKTEDFEEDKEMKNKNETWNMNEYDDMHENDLVIDMSVETDSAEADEDCAQSNMQASEKDGKFEESGQKLQKGRNYQPIITGNLECDNKSITGIIGNDELQKFQSDSDNGSNLKTLALDENENKDVNHTDIQDDYRITRESKIEECDSNKVQTIKSKSISEDKSELSMVDKASEPNGEVVCQNSDEASGECCQSKKVIGNTVCTSPKPENYSKELCETDKVSDEKLELTKVHKAFFPGTIDETECPNLNEADVDYSHLKTKVPKRDSESEGVCEKAKICHEELCKPSVVPSKKSKTTEVDIPYPIIDLSGETDDEMEYQSSEETNGDGSQSKNETTNTARESQGNFQKPEIISEELCKRGARISNETTIVDKTHFSETNHETEEKNCDDAKSNCNQSSLAGESGDKIQKPHTSSKNLLETRMIDKTSDYKSDATNVDKASLPLRNHETEFEMGHRNCCRSNIDGESDRNSEKLHTCKKELVEKNVTNKTFDEKSEIIEVDGTSYTIIDLTEETDDEMEYQNSDDFPGDSNQSNKQLFVSGGSSQKPDICSEELCDTCATNRIAYEKSKTTKVDETFPETDHDMEHENDDETDNYRCCSKDVNQKPENSSKEVLKTRATPDEKPETAKVDNPSFPETNKEMEVKNDDAAVRNFRRSSTDCEGEGNIRKSQIGDEALLETSETVEMSDERSEEIEGENDPDREKLVLRIKRCNSREYRVRHSSNQLVTFYCEYCGADFHNRWAFVKHTRHHTGASSYICDICQLPVKSNSAMRKHFRRDHPNVKY